MSKNNDNFLSKECTNCIYAGFYKVQAVSIEKNREIKQKDDPTKATKFDVVKMVEYNQENGIPTGCSYDMWISLDSEKAYYVAARKINFQVGKFYALKITLDFKPKEIKEWV